ncbi:SDR family NAD(P)-dependent oxidoreductase [Paenibacillus polymyxa]|uniref:SDR family NAD(P)-dependent oxidoreductase n=1 Tax=Paenibacillus polymyxa TaxID=1406 RepID=UPI00068FA614|nr:SDR family NAD(P)-dependent oxidoreductase [Paenibacillus polymyxa]MBE3646952.1 SDR family NAD(P)-dependent oxidoreductase [Paenibacillus polymyxa]
MSKGATPKTYAQRLTYNNLIVRDHQVHEVRTLPGVALLDMIYRLADCYLGTQAIELHHVLFMQPIITSEYFDQQILVTFTPKERYWEVKVTSTKVKNEEAVDTSEVINMNCLMYTTEGISINPWPDIAAFTDEATEQWDMEEMYELARRCEIQHFTFMKTLGNVYQRGNQEVMKLHLSELAKNDADYFYAHAALLDGASMAGMSFSKSGTQHWVNQDGSPYMPISIERFCIYQRLPSPIYTYTEEREVAGGLLINPDIITRDITVYSETGEVAVEFLNFSVKRIRDIQLIQKLMEPAVSVAEEKHKGQSDQQKKLVSKDKYVGVEESEISSLTTKIAIEKFLRQEIAKVLKVDADTIEVCEGFYELGLDSIELLRLVKILEERVDTIMYPTLLFEFSTIDSLTGYLLENHAQAFNENREDGDKSDTPTVQDERSLKTSIERYLQEEISRVVQVPASEIGLQQGFYELGLDSIDLLKLVKVLEEKVSQALYPTLLFEYSNIAALTEFLFEHSRTEFIDKKEKITDLGMKVDVNLQAGLPQTLLFERVWSRESIPAAQLQHPEYLHITLIYNGSENLLTRLERQSNKKWKILPLNSIETLPTDQFEDCFEQVFHLIQTHIKKSESSEFLIQIVADVDKDHKAVYALEGLMKTASLENHKVHGQIIMIRSMATRKTAEIRDILIQEARHLEAGTRRVLYPADSNERFVNKLYEKKLQEVASPFKEQGVYVITGGLGGLGFHVANHLARCKAKIALIGRSGLTEPQNNQISLLVQLGAEVRYYQADVGDLGAVEKIMSNIRDHWGFITGVVHAAGVVKDQFIIKKQMHEAQKVFRPKVSGIWNLDQATKHDVLECFVIFSSVSAITGNLGQADYASANGWMDAFAWERQSRVEQGKRFGQTITVNWPLWSEGGMRISEDMQDLLYKSGGSQALPTSDGLRILDTVLASGNTHTVVLYGDVQDIKEQMESIITIDPGITVGSTEMNADWEDGTGTGSVVKKKWSQDDDIAIVGLSGKYPMADNIEQLYFNLKEGRDCISDIPAERWRNNRLSYDVTEIYNYGGFLGRIDEFDPLFFNISAAQAEMMDPQARMFLQTAWEACEDAGFSLDKSHHQYPSTSDQSVGVFAGVFWNNYELFSAEMTQRGTPLAFGIAASSIANMVSYCLNFHGPSIAVDSMCSSSLTAIHLACESIRQGECDFAVAGGVNLVTHPHKYLFLKQAQFLSTDGRCRSFGEGGDGYVPGEGVGAILLTSLSKAEKEGYPIYGIIKGSAVNHVGKTSGATVPDPVAQSEVISNAIKKSGVDPRTIGYVEAHGTGTSLGDPIEIRGLEMAFRKCGLNKQQCAIGSIKSNIGHLEAASGIAGLTKILLQFKYKELFPSLHAKEINPYIDFKNSFFQIQQQYEPWVAPETEMNGKHSSLPRRAGISSFGASGSNAHLILEEYVPSETKETSFLSGMETSIIIPLSARKEENLKQIVYNLFQFLKIHSSSEQGASYEGLRDLAYTLQVGRESMPVRLSFVVSSVDELFHKMEQFIQGEETMPERAWTHDSDKLDFILETYIGSGNMEGIAQLWTGGLHVDWNRLYGEDKPHRLHLPSYPFTKERYWVPHETLDPAIEGPLFNFATTAVTPLHPVLRTRSLTVKRENILENCWNFTDQIGIY